MPSLDDVRRQIADYPHAYIMGTTKEVRALPKILEKHERILAVTSGLMKNATWLAVCTNYRLIFINSGMFFGMRLVQLPLDKIQTIDHEYTLMFGSIRVWDGANEFTLGMIAKDSIRPFVQTTVAAMGEIKQPRNHNATGSMDIASQLERLAALMDKGVLTREEFEAQKKKLLS